MQGANNCDMCFYGEIFVLSVSFSEYVYLARFFSYFQCETKLISPKDIFHNLVLARVPKLLEVPPRTG